MSYDMFLVLVLCGVSLIAADCQINYAGVEEEWGYVNVRPKAHQFFWFMKTPCSKQAPIVIWLQGGPGGSGTGYGNFMEIGPLDNNLVPRNYTWLKVASLLFIDSPVGAGFSYVESYDALTTTVYEVADDLVSTLEVVSEKLKVNFYNNSELPPIHIFSESYGGKVAPVFGAAIVRAQKEGRLAHVKLGAVAIGDGAVSLLDAGYTYPDYLFQTSQIDLFQYKMLREYVVEMEKYYEKKDYTSASYILDAVLEKIANITDDVFFYNIRYHHQPSPSLMKGQKPLLRAFHKLTVDYNGDNVKALMNKQMRRKFKVIPPSVKWGAQALKCHEYLADEMIIDVISSVDECLDAGLQVVIYNGMLDLIINSAGQDRWINKLKWSELNDYYLSKRIPLYPPSKVKDKKTGAFHKIFKNFEYYWVMMSGHMVPIDAPEMSLEMVRRITEKREQYTYV